MRAQVTSIGLSGATNLALMARIKSGFAGAVETVTYLERLKRLLNALHDSRRNMREAELESPVFPDTIGRFGIIHQFRYAIWPPLPKNGADSAEVTRYLTLNVSFDGGWEPYMRVIYHDIGALLDALLCHCEGYPGSRNVGFDEYCRWVRDHELDAGIFYTDSPVTAADAKYLATMERILRESSNPAAAEEAIARLALPPLKQQREEALRRVAADPQRTLALPLRTLKGLFRLAPLFGNNEGRDDVVLRCFAQLVLREFVELAREITATPPKPPYAALAQRLRPFLAAFADELHWLLQDVPPGKLVDVVDETYDEQKLQNAILNRKDPVTHGCVALLSVRKRERVAQLLQDHIQLCKSPQSATSVRWQFAFTHAGLAALGVDAESMDVFAPEFAQGMEARCGILGDLRANHPNQWRRPLRYGVPAERGERIDLSTTHMVVLLRLIDPDTDAADLHPTFVDLIKQLDAEDNGVSVLAVEPTRSRRTPSGESQPEHFGFADGLSQPTPVPPAKDPKSGDEVNAGELLLGYRNDRHECALKAHQESALFLDGSFLVMRKLRQRLDRLHSRLDAAYATRPDEAALVAEASAKMMGRSQKGDPLLHPAETAQDNGFNFNKDPEGRFCPFQSHIRRANPRDGRDYMPRILRRGMSYGPSAAQAGLDADRGVLFMAYCASIAEQFEIIQGWVAGGNSSGLSSAQGDPFLAVPRPGERRTFRYFDQQGQLQRVDLGDQPFVELQWGLYLFVPSIAGLGALAEAAQAASRPVPAKRGNPPAWNPAGGLESWRERLEVQDRSPAVWAQVREQPGGRAVADGYGTLVGSLAGVKQVLKDFARTRYSVKEYAQRMEDTIGVNFLGLDPTDPLRKPQADAVNKLIDKVTEAQAFAAAWPLVQGVIRASALLDQPPGLAPGDDRIRRPIDLVSLGEHVLAGLCTHWFGLPENPAKLKEGETPFMVFGGRNEGDRFGTGTPRCPGELLSSSRTIFAPHPNDDARHHGLIEGGRVRKAVRQYLLSERFRPELTVAIVEALKKNLSTLPAEQVQDIIERNLAGMLLGFPPTVFGNFMQVTKTWIEEGTLWDHQQAVAEAASAALSKARKQAQDEGRLPPRELDMNQLFECASIALRPRLMATMRGCPIPEMLWRSPVGKDGQVDTEEGHRVVVGIRSALAELADDADAANGRYDELMFGGSRKASSDLRTVHACPGYKMGVGVLLALLSGLLLAGMLRPTGSPVLLMLTPKVPTP